MLREFSCANFFSFDEEQRLSFVTTSPRPFVSFQSLWGDGLVTALAGLGPNASGKTNLLKALVFLQWFIHNTVRQGEGSSIFLHPCAFAEKNRPSEFTLEVEDPNTGRRYRYEAAMTVREVVSEYLYRRDRPRGQWQRLLARERDEAAVCGYAFEIHKSLRMRRDLFEPTLRTTVSFFHAFHILSGKELNDFFRLTKFHSNIDISGRHEGIVQELLQQVMLKGLHGGKKLQRLLGGILSRLDTGIQAFSVTKEESRLGDASAGLATAMRISMESSGKEDLDAKQKSYWYDVNFTHQHGEGTFQLPMGLQSGGTRELFFLVNRILFTLIFGGVLVYDELECGLHPLVLPHLVGLFADPDINRNKAQLICTCHAPDLLRRLEKEQIFLVEKDARGASRVSRLDDFEGVRRDDNYVAKYLAGAYGALPKTSGPLLPPDAWRDMCDAALRDREKKESKEGRRDNS